MAELDRLDREYGVGAMPGPSYQRPQRARRRHGPVLPGLLVSALVLAAVVVLSPAEDMRSLRRLAGFDDDRLGVAPRVAHGVGSYEFMATERGSHEPVAYDPCRVVEVAVNPQGAPQNYDQLVDTAIQHTGDATGLRFERVGSTDDRDVSASPIPRRRPVLVAWATAEEVPDLAGDVAGIGGSIAADGGTGRMRYLTGKVILDRDVFAAFETEDTAEAQAIVDHEFGHLVGLDHVDDPGELMNSENIGRTTYGPGDREGLARLGGVDC
jgi:Matrixin